MNEQKSIIQLLREPRINIFDVDIALLDLSATFLGAYLIAKKMEWNPWITIAGSIPVGYFAHTIFQVETPLNNKINEMVAGEPQKLKEYNRGSF